MPYGSSSSGAMRNSPSTQPSTRASSAASKATRSQASGEAIAATVRGEAAQVALEAAGVGVRLHPGGERFGIAGRNGEVAGAAQFEQGLRPQAAIEVFVQQDFGQAGPGWA